jgi:hypothetical protein
MTEQEEQKVQPLESRLYDSQVQALLKEYELTRTTADHLEENTWNTTAVLVTGLIAGLAGWGRCIALTSDALRFVIDGHRLMLLLAVVRGYRMFAGLTGWSSGSRPFGDGRSRNFTRE